MLSLVGLKDRYEQDGRVLQEFLTEDARPEALNEESLGRLARIYKQIEAPFGAFAANTLVSSTRAVASGSSTDDSTYLAVEGKIQSQTRRRDALVAQIRSILNRAAFGGGESRVDEKTVARLVRQAQALLADSARLAAG
jgi:hypothetical protein